MQVIETHDDWAQARALPHALVYKHSPICGISSGAMRQVKTFASANPDVPILVVDVLGNRELSQEIAADLGVVHQSPQAIVLRKGTPGWFASHGAITASRLQRAVCLARFRGDPAHAETECGQDPAAALTFFTIPRWLIYLAVFGILVALLRLPQGGQGVMLILGLAAGVYLLGRVIASRGPHSDYRISSDE